MSIIQRYNELLTVNLKTGKNLVETWFQDADGKDLCSAYYTEFKLK